MVRRHHRPARARRTNPTYAHNNRNGDRPAGQTIRAQTTEHTTCGQCICNQRCETSNGAARDTRYNFFSHQKSNTTTKEEEHCNEPATSHTPVVVSVGSSWADGSIQWFQGRRDGNTYNIRIDRAERERDQSNQQTQSHQLDRWYTKTGGQTGPNGRLYWSNQGNTTRFGTERRDLNATNACIADKSVVSVSTRCLRTQKMEHQCSRAKWVAKRGKNGWKRSIWYKTAVSPSKQRHPGDRTRVSAPPHGATPRLPAAASLMASFTPVEK